MRQFGAAALAAALVWGSALPVFADAQEDLRAAQEEQGWSETQLNDAQERIHALESKKGEAESYLAELDRQLGKLTEQLTDLQAQYKDKQAALDISTEELAEAEADAAVQRKNMALRIRYIYEHSNGSGHISALLTAGSFTSLLNAAENVRQLNQYDRDMLDRYLDTISRIEETQKKLSQEKADIEVLVAESESKKQELSALHEDTQQQVAEYAASLEGEEGAAADLLTSIEARQATIAQLTLRAADEVAAAEAKAAAEAAQRAAAEQEAARQAAERRAQAAQQTNSGADGAQAWENANRGTSEQVQVDVSTERTPASNAQYSGAVLTREAGRVQGPSGQETYYNMDMSGVVAIMRNMGNTDKYWVREDGVKMLGDYILVAANLETHPRGSIVETSLGKGIVADTGDFAVKDPQAFDIATGW